jgi:hypothetical protein
MVVPRASIRRNSSRVIEAVSALVREAVRERYLGGREDRAKAMQEFVGIRKQRSEPLDARLKMDRLEQL